MRNSVLAGLLASDYQHLLPKLEPVMLTDGQVLYHPDQEIEYVYFPDDAVVAMIDAMEDGRTVEVGIIGREGIVGINVFLGGVITPDKAVVQLSGGAMRMSADKLREEMRFGSPLQQLLLAYARTFLAGVSMVPDVPCSSECTLCGHPKTCRSKDSRRCNCRQSARQLSQTVSGRCIRNYADGRRPRKSGSIVSGKSPC